MAKEDEEGKKIEITIKKRSDLMTKKKCNRTVTMILLTGFILMSFFRYSAEGIESSVPDEAFHNPPLWKSGSSDELNYYIFCLNKKLV